jgi:hypothetical protein
VPVEEEVVVASIVWKQQQDNGRRRRRRRRLILQSPAKVGKGDCGGGSGSEAMHSRAVISSLVQ